MNDSPRLRIVIIGATSSIAEHCARIWVRSRVDIVLVGRSISRLVEIADDLRVRSPSSSVTIREADFHDPSKISALARDLMGATPIDIVLIAHGSLPDQQACQGSLEMIKEAVDTNAISPVLFAEAFASLMAQRGVGAIGIIGSVAGDRGRKTNYVYGAAKGMVERYVQGLQHRLARSAVRVCLIKPGPTATPMTSHLPPQGLADPAAVAARIVNAIGRGTPVVYVPGKWWLIMMVIRHLPRAVFNKLNI